jgi:hypothetical protein
MARSNPTLSELKVRMAVMSLPSTIDQGTRRMRGRCPKRTVALPFSRGFSIALCLSGVDFSVRSCVCIVALDAMAASQGCTRFLSVLKYKMENSGCKRRKLPGRWSTQCSRANMTMPRTCISAQSNFVARPIIRRTWQSAHRVILMFFPSLGKGFYTTAAGALRTVGELPRGMKRIKSRPSAQ